MGQNLGPLNIKDTYQSLVQISGSVLTDGSGSTIPSLTVNASTATSASYALTASYAANVPATASYAVSASHANSADSSLTSTSASYATYAATAGAASTATTATSASHALYADAAGTTTTATTASYVTTSPTNDNTAFDLVFVADELGATQALRTDGGGNITYNPSTDVLTAGTFSGNATTATSASHAVNADSAQTSVSASHAIASDASISASHAVASDTAISASYATTASFALNVSTPNLQIVTDAGATTTNAITASGMFVNGPAVISGDLDVNGTITYISSSTLQIGDNVIEINYNKAAGNSGILTYDTTSPFTASLLWDATADRWIAGAYGSEKTIILASDTGSMSVENAVSASHAVNADSALTATSASHAVASDTSISASHAVNADSALTATSASYASTATSASHAVNADSALTASYVAGNAGQLKLSGSTYYATNEPLTGPFPYLDNVVIGYNATSTGYRNVLIGNNADAGAVDGTGVGMNTAVGSYSVAIGNTASNTGQNSVAVGARAIADLTSVAIGYQTYATSSGAMQNAIAIGNEAKTTGNFATGLGGRAKTYNDYALAIGADSNATGSLAMDIRVNNASIMTATTASQDVTFAGDVIANLQGNADTSTTASYALTASYLEGGVTTPTLNEVTAQGSSSSATIYADGGIITQIITPYVNTNLDLGTIGTGDINITSAGGDIIVTGSIDSLNNITAPTFIGALQGNADTATTASYAITASYALNGGGTADTGSLLTTASISDATITFTKGDATTFDIVVNNVVNADSASVATTATSASHAVQADSALAANTATSASYASTATSASHAVFADTAGSAGSATTAVSASHAVQADNALTADSATTATSASHAVFADTAGTATTATTATTASYILGSNVDGAVALATTASYAVTSSLPLRGFTNVSAGITSFNNDVLDFDYGDGTSTSFTVIQVASASFATTALTASYLAGGGAAGLVAGSAPDSMKNADSLVTNPATAAATGSIVLGDNASISAGNDDAIAIGRNAQSTYWSVTIGRDAQSTGIQEIAIGRGASSGNYGAVFGFGSTAGGGSVVGRASRTQQSGVALGGDAYSDGSRAIAIGAVSQATTDRGLALGDYARATGSFSFDMRAGDYSMMYAYTGSATVGFREALRLDAQDPLPTGDLGMLAVSGSALYFHNGSTWTAIS